MTGVLIRRGILDTDIQTCRQGEGHAKMKAEIEVMLLRVKEH